MAKLASVRKPVGGADAAHGYEFGGPLGAVGISLGLPILVYLSIFLCNDISGCPVPAVLHPSSLSLEKLAGEIGWPAEGALGLGSLSSLGWVLAYYLVSLVLQAALPGVETEGTVLASGGRLPYKFNAFTSAVTICVVALAGTVMQGADFPLWTFIWDHYLQIFTANLVISFVLACFVYARSFQVRAGNAEKRELAPGGHSGNIMYDWFIGRELNPRVTLPVFGTIDIKTFCEVRPGLLGWFMLDAAFMAHQYKVHGYLTDSMIMTVTFQGLYVFDALWMEPSILTQIDITSDGFGFMLAFGDLAWLPFLYSLQARYLAVHPVRLGVAGVAGILVFQGLGYYIFRSSNNEKDRFRKNPQDPRVSHLRYIETPSGGKLITSGWWGTARHINYCGDLIMAWSYCLPTAVAGYLVRPSPNAPMDGAQAPTGGAYGGGSPATTRVVPGEARGWGMVITYFYVVYFAVLLIHRERRDELKCRRKYGPTWDEYKRLVPWRIIPWVY